MYGFILFKNSRGTTKLNLQLHKSIDSLAELTEEQATIIDYMAIKNNYNFTISNELDLNAATIDEKSINFVYCKKVIEIERNNQKIKNSCISSQD